MSEPTLLEILGQGRTVAGHRPWPRVCVTPDVWNGLAQGLTDQRWALLGLWGEAAAVHIALTDSETAEIAVASLACPEGRFPSVGRVHPPAIRLERTIRDLFALEPAGAPDPRPWLDHGRWPRRGPLASHAESGPTDGGDAAAYPFLPVEGEGLHQIPVGPVHAGIIEPGHFRFTANGETVVRLEQRLGYVHKGIEHLFAGASLERAARLAGRISGDSTVAYALAFARAAEAATKSEAPPRAHWLRALMAELERLANHFGDVGAICNDAAFALFLAHAAVLREKVLRAADQCFGHRLMMDRIVPGGVNHDLKVGGAKALGRLLADIRTTWPQLVTLYDDTSSLQDRTGSTGVTAPDLVRQFAPGGFVGRAAGRAVDARRHPGYPPYDALSFTVPVLEDGDVNARVWVRIREIEQSVALIEQILAGLPTGPVHRPLPPAAGEGMALVEGFRGDVLVWVRITEGGLVARCHARDPSWFQWPLLEAAIEGNIVADFPLCNKSFNCSYSGCDL